MTRLEFNELVERLSERYEGRPRALTRAVACWLAAGYAVLFSGLAAALVGGTAFVAAGLWMGSQSSVWLVAGGALAILAGLGVYRQLIWTPRPPIDDYVLGPNDAPELHRLIEEVRQVVGCAAFHRVILDARLNASVHTIPRLGLLGWSRKDLLLGLPLLEAVTPDQFRAVLAHEFVHHSRNHGRFAVWVYRVRSNWEQVFRDLESSSWRRTVSLARIFLRWFWPRMNARAFLLCREQEYAADRFAAEHAGAAAAAEALWRIETCDRYLDANFWPVLQRTAERMPEPPGDLMPRLGSSLREAPDSRIAPWCSAATRARLTDTQDTHPSWTDRATAVEEDPAAIAHRGFPGVPRPSAALALFGDDLPRISAEISKRWAQSIRETWTTQHRRSAGLRRRLRQILPLIEARPDDFSLGLEQAKLVHELDGPEAAATLLEGLRERNPQHHGTAFELGQLALERGDASGVALLDEIVRGRRDSFYVPACTALYGYFRLTGRFDEMREMEARLDGRDAWADWLREGHQRLARNATFLPHDLSPEKLAAVTAALGAHADLSEAWLARVDQQAPGALPLYVLCVMGLQSFLAFRPVASDPELSQRLVSRIPVDGRLLVIPRRGFDRRLARRILAVPNAKIHP